MRNLIIADVYKMSKIMSKIGIKLDVKDKDQSEVGAELITKVVENLHLAEREVNDFLGGLIGKTGDEFAQLSIHESFVYIEEFKKLNGVKDFLKLASHSMTQK
jgi:hypothetical protein